MIEEMKNQYGKVGTWILIVLGVLIVGGGLYLLIHPQTSLPTDTATTTPPVQVNTYGMTQYTDQDFGLSFWYPSSWQILPTITKDTVSFPGGTLVKTLQVGSTGGVMIYIVNSPAQTITDEQNGHASPIAQTKYFYDSASEQWMVAYPEGINSGNSGATTTANISNTTMSGLIMLPSGRRFDTSIIPLNTTNFLVVSDGGGNNAAVLAKTISLAGVSVDSSILSTALQVEENAYTAVTKPQACPQTAKECPDGSYVGPTGPNCTFVCPSPASSTSTTPDIQQLSAPGSVSLRQGGVAEIRNKSFYFALQSLSLSSATIQITPVGCWNSFPSDPPPQVRCMIAVVRIPPQTLSVGQTYGATNYGVMLTQINNSTATFSVSVSSAVQ